MKGTKLILAAILFAAGWMSSAVIWAQNQHVIFRIGEFNASSGEFLQGAPKSGVVFEPKALGDASGWYARQTVAAKGTVASAASDTQTVAFTLPDKPKGHYVLRVSVVIETPGVPILEANINGKTGRLFFSPKLNYLDGDRVGEADPIYSQAETSIEIPASYLHQGKNTLAFRAVAADEDISDQAHLVYDAVELDHALSANDESDHAKLVPAIFYKRDGAFVKEEVDAILPFDSAYQTENTVSLNVNGNAYHSALQSSGDFGQVKVPLWVSEFQAGAKGQLTWGSGGKKRRQEFVLDPARKWTIYVVPHVHLDVGFTDYQAKVASAQSRVIDEALDFMKRTPDFRFSVDGSWNIEQFMRERTPEERQRAIQQIREKHLFVPAQYANLLTGVASNEALIRSLYPSADFSRRYGTPFNYANITDVPSYSWSYASVLGAAGIHDFAAASNNTRGPVLLQGHLNQKSPFWWEGPDGQKVLTWYSRTYLQMQYTFGLPPKFGSGRETLPLFLQQYDSKDYRADSVILFGTQVENTDLSPGQAAIAQQWNQEFAWPVLRYSGFYDAMQAIAQQLGDQIPVIKGDGAPYWEDGVASDAYYTAMERETEAQAVSAEKLQTLSTQLDSRVAADTEALSRMWKNIILMDEHTWGAFASISDPKTDEAVKQLEVKDKLAVDADAESDYLATNAMATIASGLKVPRGSAVVFNMLNWPRSGFVVMDIPKGWQIVDAENKRTVPYQVIAARANVNHVRFLASGVPGLGYKIFTVLPGNAEGAEGSEQAASTLESRYYKVVLDPVTGAVKSIYDKELGRELVDSSSPYHFGQYLYVTGGDKEPNNLLRYSPILPNATLTVHPAVDGRLLSVRRTPWGEVATLESSAPQTPRIIAEIEVFDNEKKIEFREEVQRTATTAKEAAYFAFPFAADRPRFHYEIQNGAVDPAKDLYPGAGHEWYSVQHWVSVEDSAGKTGTVMALDAPLVTLGDINRGLWPDTFQAKSGTVFSYIMNNYWFTNYRAEQGGTFRFRYVVTSSEKYDPIAMSRQGWEEATNLLVDQVRSQDIAQGEASATEGPEKSFLTISDPDVLVQTWKPAEDGNGTILRLLDLGGSERTISVESDLLIGKRAFLTNAVEQGGSPMTISPSGRFEVPIHSHQILTVRIAPAASQATTGGN